MALLIEGRIFWLIALLFIAIVYIWLPRMAAQGTVFGINRVAALDAIDDMIDECAERGKTALMSPGDFALTSGYTAAMIIGIEMVGITTRKCLEKGVIPVVGVKWEDNMAPVLEAYRDAYASTGKMDEYDETNVIFYGKDAFRTAMMGNILRDKPGALFSFGNWWNTPLYMGMTAKRVDTRTFSGSVDFDMATFHFISNENVLLADEIYASGAYVSDDPIKKNSIAAQDLVKLGAILLTLIGAILNTLGLDIISRLITI